jgi:flagellar motor switch/type III secretory pathway protein FliN
MPEPIEDKRDAYRVRVEFGRKIVQSGHRDDLLGGGVVELDTFADDYVGIYAENRLIARGKAVVIDGKLGVRVQETLIG